MKQNLQARSANTAKILWDGNEIGLMQNVRFGDDYSPEPASGIGNIHVQEYVPTMARHTITAGMMALRNKSLYQLGIVPENGDAVLQGMVFDIEIYDSSTNTLTRKYLNCSYASGDMQIQKHQILSFDVTFNALDVAGTL